MTTYRNEFGRLIKKDPQAMLFEHETTTDSLYWGMPECTIEDARPYRRISINFETVEDLQDFAEATGIRITEKTDSAWYPHKEKDKPRAVFYTAPKQATRYPVCIPSKGRYDNQTTAKLLDQSGVDYKFLVEETEYEIYCERLGADRVVCLPFHDLGQGSIPARNAIWDWAQERGCARHWVLDDNIIEWIRFTGCKRIPLIGGGVLNAIEDFADRFENVALAGPHSRGFVPEKSPSTTPIHLNSRVYSCILINTSLPHRWRGRYNEDTDLSLRVLKDGYCTVLFRSLLMRKPDTVGGKNAKPMAGGNTDNVYNGGDHRLAFAQSLHEQHPDCVSVVWKYNRWHHEVDYSRFKDNRLIPKPGVVPVKTSNEYGMVLHRADSGEMDA